MITRFSIILGILFFYDISVFAGKAPRISGVERRALLYGYALRADREALRLEGQRQNQALRNVMRANVLRPVAHQMTHKKEETVETSM
ncbi:hypothetical protein EBR77_03960 [bacterium]|nr:hypothetical protein [bacterium]NBX78630.1 hypothetical protein [bacterium]